MIIVATAVRIFSLFPSAVERFYTNGIYPWIGYVQRLLFGWIPFSIGDLLYAFAVIWLIRQLIAFIQKFRKRTVDKHYLKNAALKTLTIALGVYIIFNVLWGLNYNRYGIDYQLRLESLDYVNEDLIEVTEQLVMQLNELQQKSLETRDDIHNKKYLFDVAEKGYDSLATHYSIFDYRMPSVKPSIYSYLGNYLGFTGYYNPFTGEAQVNTAVPTFIRPFTACHEIGHQLGYAKESEANFAAYLSGTASADPSFRYSVYFQLYAYAARYLSYADSTALKSINARLAPGVKKDIKELRRFFDQYNNPFETAIDKIYAEYLKANEQPSGKMSYNEVVGMLIAYYKRNGRL